MNTKQLAGVVVFVLVFGVASNSLVNSAFAQDAKVIQDKAKAGAQTSDSGKKPMTKVEKQKENREKQKTNEAAKTAKDKAKADTFTKNSKQKAKSDTKASKDKAKSYVDKTVKTKSNNLPSTTTQKITTQKVSTSKDIKAITDKPEGKSDKADTVKGTK
ncbi:MAG TPA: hypothetical protein VGR54_04165 [Nitrosopumilaceae archaeon]|nr:hypothetical protein [Nitrosopumilaceae archaeon]